MAKNSNLHTAKNAKNDEFYTQLSDIEKELNNYKDFFNGKVVYCNCNDPRESNFFKFFSMNFERFGLKKLITTGYKKDGHGVAFVYDGDKNGNRKVDETEIHTIQLEGNGGYETDECIAFLKEADVVVTNPPFSCYSDDTEVLTDEGWKLFKDVNGNEMIFSLNPFTKETSYTNIVRKYEKKVNEELYHFKKRGIDLIVTENHRMLVNQSKDKILTADKIKGEYHTLPIRGFNYKNKTDIRVFTLPKTKQLEKYSRKKVEIKEKTIDLNKWLEFFGFWIADGYTRNRINVNGNRDYTIGIKQKLDNSEYVENLFNNIGFPCKVYKNGNKANFCVYSKQLWEYLLQFGTSTTKYIPRWILNLPKENLQYLLKGYLNGDSNGNDKDFRIGSVSKQLCSDLAEIILKVDGRIINFIPKKSKGNEYYQASFSKQNLSRENIKYPKPEKIKYDRSVYCLELEKNHIMFVRRNGIAIWCGNCFRAYVKQLMDYNKKFLILGNNNAITYKDFFPYIKSNQVWLGRTLFTGKMPYFKVSENYKLENDRYERRSDGLYKQVNGICWFTNIPNDGNREILDLFKKYNPEEYPKYDNYNAIECGRMIYLPMDYDGVIGVPITSLKYLYSDGKIHTNIDGVDTQFEIVKFRKGNDDKDLSINGYTPYFRILIKKLS